MRLLLLFLYLISVTADARVRCREVDSTPPTTPSGLSSTSQTTTQIGLTWLAAKDNVGVSGYNVFSSGVKIGAVSDTMFTVTGLVPGTSYTYQIQAYDAQDNKSSRSAALAVSTVGDVDTTEPSQPTDFALTEVSSTAVDLDWTASTDNIAVTGYKVFQDGAQIATVTTNSYSVTGLTPDTSYTFAVSAFDAAGNNSTTASLVYDPADTTAPTAPPNLTATGVSLTAIDLDWGASTDAVGVTGYRVFKDGVELATTTNTAYSVTGLTANTSYDFAVSAYDAAANESTQSVVTSFTGCTKTTINAASATSDGGFAYILPGDYGAAIPDTEAGRNLGDFQLRLFEDGVELGPNHALHYDIRNTGLGAFSHKADNDYTNESLRWSASNNTDVRSNGKTYSYCAVADPVAPPPDPPPVVAGAAFPGAMGGGAGSDGGAGGSVIEVTNLNDSGSGSLRACVQLTGARTCVFRVAGIINLTSSLSVSNPYLTVAGQTAPGGGILIKASGLNMVMINGHNIVWQYTRVRNAYSTSCSNSSTSECGQTMMVFGHDIMVDHNSTSWNQDEGIGSWGWSTSDSPKNITISNNLIAEGLSSHSTGAITGGANANIQTNIDYVRNIFMNNSHRNPLLKNKSSRIVNNIFYNNRRYANQFMGGISVDVIGNLYKKGPMFGQYAPNSWDWHEVQISTTTGTDSPNTSTAPTSPKIYMEGNKGWYQTNPAADNWLMTANVPGENNAETNSGPAATSYKRSPYQKLADTTFPIVPIDVTQLDTAVVPNVGASRRLACGGGWVANRDSVDTRLISQYQNNTGISALAVTENSAGIGGFPTIAAGTPCTDSDHDGMPDEYEIARGFNANNAADRNTVAGNGYTNLQNYLEGL